MIRFLYKKNVQILIILLHIVLGYIAVRSPMLTGLYFVAIFLYFLYDVIYTRDEGSRAGFYVLYIIGFEIVYRITGATISAELAKYLSIILLIAGLLSGKWKYIQFVFIFALFLLIPAMFFTKTDDPVLTRKVILFNISGPLTMIFSGLYFYKRKISKLYYDYGMRLAFYPAIALLVLLTLNAGLDQVDFHTVNSKTSMAGNYAPNQVSTAIGWLFLLGLIELIRGNKLLLFVGFDVAAVTYLLIRGLLTMSRGGILGAFVALLFTLFYALLIDQKFRKVLKQIFIPGLLTMLILFGGMWYVNKLSNNYILYRYQGKSTQEVLYGRTQKKDYTTGRGKIMEGDILAFKEYPILGVGYGMSRYWHAVYLGRNVVAHTEFSRLLSENGLMGLIIILLCYVFLPMKFFFTIVFKQGSQIHFIAFLIYSYITMLHSAMRLAIPGILYGAAFMIIVYSRQFVIKK